MQITGFKKRSISDQKDVVDFNFALTFNTMSGRSECGLSGSSVFGFSFQDGRVYDPVGKFVSSYRKGIPVVVSGQLGQTSYDYSINGVIGAIGNPTGSGTYSWIYANSPDMDFNGSVQGQLPSYSLPNSGEYRFQSDIITGNIVNLDPSLKFRIFNAYVSQPGAPYDVEGFTTGDIAQTGQILISSNLLGLNDYFLPITLDTNFGSIGFQMAISGDRTVTPDIYVGLSPDTPNVYNSVSKAYTAQISNFPANAQIGIMLEFVSGVTGNVYYFKQQSSDLIVESITGNITGTARLSKLGSWPLSGLDPKTNIWETGIGTGTIFSDSVSAVGPVSYDYNQKIFGVGNGSFVIDYIISGNALLDYNVFVPLTGGYLIGTTDNLFGTGSSPTATTGIAPHGTGRVLVYPTGAFTLPAPLTSGDYFNGYLSVPQVFTGQLSTSYGVLGVGWATGDRRTGIVDTHFVLDFEPGYYQFSKYFSGAVSGLHTTMENFNPSSCELTQEVASGVLAGTFYFPAQGEATFSQYGYSGAFIDCLQVTGLPSISFTGLPAALYDADMNLVQPHRVFLMTPNEGFLPTETSDSVLASIYTRTKTSRMGVTSSGTGRFNQIVNTCLFSGDWTESMTTFGTSYLCSPTGNYYGYVHSESNVPFSDTESMRPNYVFFGVSGSGARDLFLRGEGGSAEVSTAVGLYKEVYYASPATGVLHQTEFVSGASIKIGTGAYTFTTYTGNSSIPANQFRSLIELRNILNSGALSGTSPVIGDFVVGPHHLFLTTTGSGTAFNGVLLSGSRGLLFDYPYTTGAYDLGQARYEQIGFNNGWQSADGDTFNAMETYGLTPSSTYQSALFKTVDTGNYYSVISARNISAGERGYISFYYPTYTGCRNHDFYPLTLERTEGTEGTITGVISFQQYVGPDFASKGTDYVGVDITFSFGPGQTGLTLYPGILDNGVFSVTQRVDALLQAQYYNSSSSAVSGENIAPVFLLNNNNPISGYDATCQSIYFPGGTGSGIDIIRTPNTPNTGGWFGGIGDTHLTFFNDHTQDDYSVSPMNVDDNSSPTNLLWFYAKTVDGAEYTMYYNQKPSPAVAGGFFVDNINISSVGTIHSDFTDIVNEHYTLADMLTTKISTQGFMSDGSMYNFFRFGTQPGNGWFNCVQLGGAFYYILKKAALNPGGTFNNPMAPYTDGISDFLKDPINKGRGAFERGPTLGLNVEETSFDQTFKIIEEWNDLCEKVGATSNADWDDALHVVSNLFIEFPHDDNINEIISFSTPCTNTVPPVNSGDCNLNWVNYPSRYSGVVNIKQARQNGDWMGSVNVYVYMIYQANGTPATPVTITISDGNSRTIEHQVTPGCCQDSGDAFPLVATITIDEIGNLSIS